MSQFEGIPASLSKMCFSSRFLEKRACLTTEVVSSRVSIVLRLVISQDLHANAGKGMSWDLLAHGDHKKAHVDSGL